MKCKNRLQTKKALVYQGLFNSLYVHQIISTLKATGPRSLSLISN